MGRGTIEIKTDRLLLRRHVEEDAVPLNRNFGLDPEMVKYSGWNPYATGENACRAAAPRTFRGSEGGAYSRGLPGDRIDSRAH